MIEHIAIVSLITWGIHFAFRDGSILHGIARIFERTLGTTAAKPVFLCPPCMGSVYGFTFGFYWHGLEFEVAAIMFAVCGLNFIIKSFVYPEYEEVD